MRVDAQSTAFCAVFGTREDAKVLVQLAPVALIGQTEQTVRAVRMGRGRVIAVALADTISPGYRYRGQAAP